MSASTSNGPASPASAPAVRFDDRTTGAAWVLHEPLGGGEAYAVGDVRSQLRAAERAALDGAWVAVVVAYEAAPAFDRAMPSKPPPAGLPLLWWRAFARRDVAPALDPVASPVTDRHRAANVLPYPDAVQAVRAAIERGDVFQVNITDRFHGSYDGSAYDVYRALVGVQTCRYGAYVDLGDHVVVSASPELFFEWDDAVLTCRPMKGTAPRQPRPADDRHEGERLLASSKDRAENVMIVDLLRNDVSRVARLGTVEVPELFRLERYETVWQLTSTVTARPLPGTTLVDVFDALFPCGSVTGAPKIAAMQMIDALEREPRGVYCGAVGLLAPPGAGAPRARFSVPIRTAVAEPASRRFVYGAGGGITWSSDPIAEDDEVRAKARILTRSHRTFELFETVRHQPGGGLDALVHLDDHLDRLAASAAWFGFPFDRSRALAALDGLAAVDTAHRVRLRLGAHGEIGVDHVVLDDGPAPVRLAVDTEVTASDDPFCCHKTTWRVHYEAARRRHPGIDDVVLVNERGDAIETTIANLAYRIDGRWFTPPLADGGLPGVARGRLVADGTLAERSIAAAGLADCESLAVVNDLRGWRPAVLAEAPSA